METSSGKMSSDNSETAPLEFRFLGKFTEANSSEHRGPEWSRNVEYSQQAVNKTTGKAGEPDTQPGSLGSQVAAL